MEYSNVVGGYTRAPLAEESCYNMARTPVDYAMKPGGWQQNPQYRAMPSARFQPLEYGPIDFYADRRRLDENNGMLFQQYRNDYPGCGIPEYRIENDIKNRLNVLDLGDVARKRRMDDAWNPAFGPDKRQPFTENVFDRLDPTRQKIYGGNRWLHYNRLESS